ncbi:MAG TPA: hypothetical protein HA263_04055 [Methanoregulaceae archaeon]|nr:hypothetical protein [Methanoregulaceae archaeon]
MARVEFVSRIEFVAQVDDDKDCLMAQDETQSSTGALWFNIDVPKGHGFASGDQVRITIERV